MFSKAFIYFAFILLFLQLYNCHSIQLNSQEKPTEMNVSFFNVTPFICLSPNAIPSGIEYNLLEIMAKKLKISVQYELLNSQQSDNDEL